MKLSLFGPPQKTFSVGELCLIIRRTLEQIYDRPIRVVGEVTGYSLGPSGHIHFGLKDARGFVRCICYQDGVPNLSITLPLPEGLAVEVLGRVSTYVPRSQYQLTVDDIVAVGYGELHRQFELLKEKLRAEGLFDAERKRPVPSFVRRVALVTSREAAALSDFVTTAQRRGAHVEILLVHSSVQGVQAAGELARAIRFAGTLNVDVIVVARGGGSLEDLWAFNTEIVARAIAYSTKPVISAVGHESDFTIADFVADERAATPTAAAELVAAERLALLARLKLAATRLRRGLQRLALQAGERLERARIDLVRSRERCVDVPLRRIDELSAELARLDPRRGLRELERRVAEWRFRLNRAALGELERGRQRFDVLAARVAALSPHNTLARGYAIVYDAGGCVITDSAAVKVGTSIDIQLRRGRLGATVRDKRRNDEQA